jgi:NitT/TauT family transport system substrate-binding protein
MHASARPGPIGRRAPLFRRRHSWILLVVMAVTTSLSACGGDDGSPLAEVRLGYFANVTHAPAIVAVSEGMITDELGDVALWTTTFNAGNDAITALFSGALDMTFIGPNPAVNAFAQSGGQAIRIVSGATSGGAAFVVSPGIGSPDDLRGRRFATPALANTQDVAFRAWLLDNGLVTDLEGGGDVSIVPQANAQILETFRTGAIDGAWVPEPWASRLVIEGGAVVYLDERELWPDGDFVTTHLIVRTGFLEEHPEVVASVIRALIRAIDLCEADPVTAREIVNQSIEAITGRALADETLERSWSNMRFTVDPLPDTLRKSADDAVRVGLLDPIDLDGIYDLDVLNSVLVKLGREEVGS